MVCTNLPHFKVVERIFGMHKSDSLWMATLNLSNRACHRPGMSEIADLCDAGPQPAAPLTGTQGFQGWHCFSNDLQRMLLLEFAMGTHQL